MVSRRLCYYPPPRSRSTYRTGADTSIPHIILQGKSWCITINNWSEEDYLQLTSLEYVYLIIGKEVGEQGTPHLQAYVHLRKNSRLRALSSQLPRAHLTLAKGSAAQNRVYCSKSGDYVEYGELPRQGKRNDLIPFRNDVQSGSTDQELSLQYLHIMAAYPRFATTIRSIVGRAEQNERIRSHHPFPTVTYIWGPTSTGKTSSVYARHDPADIYSVRFKSDGHIWFDGYEGQKIILIDEFYGQCKPQDVLQLLRPYQVRMETKGGVVWPVYDQVYITSNLPPHDLYRSIPESVRQAILARITTTIHQTGSTPGAVLPTPGEVPVVAYTSLGRQYIKHPQDTYRQC